MGLRALLDANAQLDERRVRSEFTVLCLLATWTALVQRYDAGERTHALFAEVMRSVAHIRQRDNGDDRTEELYDERGGLYVRALDFVSDGLAGSELMALTDTWVDDWSRHPIQNVGLVFALMLGRKGDPIIAGLGVAYLSATADGAERLLAHHEASRAPRVEGASVTGPSTPQQPLSPTGLSWITRARHHLASLIRGPTEAEADARSFRETFESVDVLAAFAQATQALQDPSTKQHRHGLQILDRIAYRLIVDGNDKRLRTAVRLYLPRATAIYRQQLTVCVRHTGLMTLAIRDLMSVDDKVGGRGLIGLHKAVCAELGLPISPGVLGLQESQVERGPHSPRQVPLATSPTGGKQVSALPSPFNPAHVWTQASKRLASTITTRCGDALSKDIVERCSRTFVTEAYDEAPATETALLYRRALATWNAFAASAADRGDLIARLVRLSDEVESRHAATDEPDE